LNIAVTTNTKIPIRIKARNIPIVTNLNLLYGKINTVKIATKSSVIRNEEIEIIEAANSVPKK
jgi:hypothetical protein